MNKVAHLLLTLLLIQLPSAFAQAGGTAEIYRLKFDEQLAQILVKQEEQTADLMGKYVTALDRMNANYRQASNLDAVLEVMAELERAKLESSISPEHLSRLFSELAGLQNKVLGIFEGIQKAGAEDIVRLTEGYGRALQSLQTQLTKDGEIKEAIATNAMLDEALANNDYLNARAVLTPPEPAPADTASLTPSNLVKGDPDAPIRKRRVQADEDMDDLDDATGPRIGLVVIYPKVDAPKRTAKKEAIYHTGSDSMAAGSKIIATVEKITEESTTSKTRSYYERSKDISKAYIPRLVFMAGPNYNFRDATITFEYFTRSGNTRRLVKTDRATIPMLESMKSMVADAEGYINTITKSSSYESSSRSAQKPEYYGFIATIYDSGGQLIFQRCTNKTLAEFSKSTLEDLR